MSIINDSAGMSGGVRFTFSQVVTTTRPISDTRLYLPDDKVFILTA